jgi:hypothetical protein
VIRAGGFSDFGYKSISTTRNRLDEVAIFSKHLAYGRDLELECILLDHRRRPYLIQKLVFGDEFAAGLDQNHQNVERSASDGDGHPIREKLAAARVQTEAAKLHGRHLSPLDRGLANLSLSDHKHFEVSF